MNKVIILFRRIAAHPLARGSAIVLVGSTLANIGAYAYHLVVGRMLGPVSYGELASLFSFSYLLNVPSLVLQTVLTKYIAGFRANNEVGKAKSLGYETMKWLTVVAVGGVLVVLPLTGILADFLHIAHPVSILFMYLTSALWIVTVVQTSLLQGFQLFTAAMIMTNVTTVLRLIGGVIGATMGVAETVISGFVTGLIGFGAYFIPLRFVYSSKAKASGISKKEFVSYSAPSLITMLGITSLYSTDILLAKHFLPPVEAGYYAALSVMGKIVYFASSSVSYVLFPVVAERTQQQTASRNLVLMAMLSVCVVSFGISVGYFLFPRIALGFLFGASYYPAAPFVGWMGIFLSFYSLCYVLIMTLLGRGKTGVWIFVAAASVVQIGAITLFHDRILSIISANIIVSIGLFISLLLYYRQQR
jgi:O-antigen/teichoic acid export membrane protein